ncbi:MAG: alkyl sulfatase dimerization domain-containing protein [Cellvibrionaceae bacterium]
MKPPVLISAALIAFSLWGCEPPQIGDTGETAYPVEFSAPDELTEHEKYLKEELFQIGEHRVWDYNTPNQGFGNVIMIEGNDGIIIVDTTTAHEHAQVAHKAFREITDKPVKAIIYTHHHADHINGAGAFTSREAVATGEVSIIASQNFMRELSDENQATAPIMAVRASYMYGQLLDPETDGRDYHISCCGYRLQAESTSYITPNRFIRDSETLTIAGIELTLFQTGGESASHLAIYLPDSKILLSGDEIQGPNYPNLHSLRGTKPRDAQKWIAALDRMRDFDSDYLVPSHGQPVIGKTEVDKVLTTYRDAIQFTHDQSIRYINKGFTPDELANTITLPEHFNQKPWMQEMYGTVKHNVREYYVAYISWWNGDPAELNPTPRDEKARRLVELMGGRDRVFSEAEKAFFDGDEQWSSELTALLVRIDKADLPARQLKAAALRRIGYATSNTNWRGFYLTSALELEGKVNPKEVRQGIMKSLFKPSHIPTDQLLENLRYRINAEEIGDKRLTVGYHFSDTKENFTLELRNGILQIHRRLLDDTDVHMALERGTLDRIFLQQLDYADAISQELITVEGSLLSLRSFGKAIDRNDGNPYLSLR